MSVTLSLYINFSDECYYKLPDNISQYNRHLVLYLKIWKCNNIFLEGKDNFVPQIMKGEVLSMLIDIVRTLILYSLVVVVLRVLGKRQIGQLQPFELVVIIMISELASVPSENAGIPLISGAVPIIVLLIAELILSYINLKSEKARKILSGRPTVIIDKGKILEAEMRRMRYSLSDLLEQLRIKNSPNIADVEYAILETNGELSVILKSKKRATIPEDLKLEPAYEGLPITLVMDGNLNAENMMKARVDRAWLETEIKKLNINHIQDVFLASLDSAGKLFIQKKDEAS